MRLAVVGAGGYVGLATAVGMATLGHEVAGVDLDAQKVRELSLGRVPMTEPGVTGLLAEALAAGNLSFTTDPTAAVDGADFVFLAVGTPAGADGTPDLSQVMGAAKAAAAVATPGAVFVVKSTVPPAAYGDLADLLGDGFGLVAFPEFLREGKIVEDFFRPFRLVVGGEEAAMAAVLGLLSEVLEGRHPLSTGEPVTVVKTDIPTAALVKYAANSYLATRVSYANEVLRVAGAIGADPKTVFTALGLDPRIGSRYLRAGIGFGGPCLPKDIAGLQDVAAGAGCATPVLAGAEAGNLEQRRWVLAQVGELAGGLQGKRVLVLGITFKPDTSDTRDSVALAVATDLAAAGMEVVAYDPSVPAHEWPIGLQRTESPTAEKVDASALLVGDAGLLAKGLPEAPLFDPWQIRG